MNSGMTPLAKNNAKLKIDVGATSSRPRFKDILI